ncbi:MAG: hypothetical protein MK101_03800 [Phycisphaerales bacterium]|nr:hypothetical protein [Phycisphaerales bacterium]
MAAEEDLIVTAPPQVAIVNDKLGLQIVGVEGQTIELIADETIMSITPEMVEIEAPEINLTAEAAVSVEAGDMDVATGGLEVQAGDLDLTAGAVEVESALFTVL